MKQAKTGTGTGVFFAGLPVYYNFSHNSKADTLGCENDKMEWINSFSIEPDAQSGLKSILRDWKLYERGWFVFDTDDNRLLNYLCQIGNNRRPVELNILDA